MTGECNTARGPATNGPVQNTDQTRLRPSRPPSRRPLEESESVPSAKRQRSSEGRQPPDTQPTENATLASSAPTSERSPKMHRIKRIKTSKGWPTTPVTCEDCNVDHSTRDNTVYWELCKERVIAFEKSGLERPRNINESAMKAAKSRPTTARLYPEFKLLPAPSNVAIMYV